MQDEQDSTPSTITPRSSTLARILAFQNSSDNPKTPETIEPQPLTSEPPNPPRVRIRRRRPGVAPAGGSEVASNSDVLPSIELSESGYIPRISQDSAPPRDGLLAPESSGLRRLPSPPKTPVAQSIPSFDERVQIDWSDSQRTRASESIPRPNSVWSEVSDSSSCSIGSSDTFPSLGDSCTSPESDANDPFVFPKSRKAVEPSHMPATPTSKKRQTHLAQAKWTSDMDKHLWLTYLTYLADPTVTPFKTLPGTVPPLGVCHRVTRQAKKTWKSSRASLSPVARGDTPRMSSLDEVLKHHETPARPFPPAANSSAETLRPMSSQQTISTGSLRLPTSWPMSASSTRRRLRELCRRKPSLSPHYQRLMQNRTPSPFESSSSRGRLSSPRRSSDQSTDQSSFAVRDLNFTLATSTSATMHPGAPLSQLARESNLDAKHNHPSRSPVHQKSQSLQLSVGLDQATPQTASEIRRLASPFRPHVTMALPESSGSADPARPRLDPPLELHHPRPLSGSMKRRAQYPLGEDLFSDDPDTRRNYLEDLFRDSGGIGNGKRRIRSRGFSLGSMQHGGPSRHISDLFTPPTAEQAQEDDAPEPDTIEVMREGHPQRLFGLGAGYAEPGPATAATSNPARRLGSPFSPTGAGNVGFSNTFPRSLFPQGLEDISSLEQQRRFSMLEDPSGENVRAQRGAGMGDAFAEDSAVRHNGVLEDPFTEHHANERSNQGVEDPFVTPTSKQRATDLDNHKPFTPSNPIP